MAARACRKRSSGCRTAMGSTSTCCCSWSGWRRNGVVPIRAVRRLLKENAPLVSPDTAAAFRKKVQAVELEGEQAQLNAMAAMSATLTARRASSSETAVLQSLEAFQHVIGKNFPA